ncbi:hypothetical protein [Streptomyces sp. NPDC046985]|uniref:hypothetical protein n=1 Tax=Streptomyces sp. NPDC046985 TaxID=3155377 RepID=UPI0033EDE7A3
MRLDSLDALGSPWFADYDRALDTAAAGKVTACGPGGETRRARNGRRVVRRWAMGMDADAAIWPRGGAVTCDDQIS